MIVAMVDTDANRTRLPGGGESPEHDDGRMTVGEHLEELRRCLLRGLIALVLVCIPCIWLARYLLAILVRPLVLALRYNGQPDSLLATSPVENILVYIKVVLIAGVTLAAPYLIYQLWTFVAAGLYPQEKTWVRKLVFPSVGLFAVGVVFMYLFVLLIALNFLVGFSSWLPLPQADPNAFERSILGVKRVEEGASAATQPLADVPVVERDPEAVPDGAMWFNVHEQRLKIRGGEETFSYQFQRDEHRAMVTTHFKIGEYLTFVLMMTIAFGVAFQMPLVVLFLARSGIVPVEVMRRYRKVVILVIVFVAGILAPPDLLSHVLLSLPMYLLFELGMLLAGREAGRASEA